MIDIDIITNARAQTVRMLRGIAVAALFIALPLTADAACVTGYAYPASPAAGSGYVPCVCVCVRGCVVCVGVRCVL
jgi:hypothetical protein